MLRVGLGDLDLASCSVVGSTSFGRSEDQLLLLVAELDSGGRYASCSAAEEPWTNDPESPSYEQHRKSLTDAAVQPTVRVYEGHLQPEGGGPKQFINVRETPEGNFYVDVPRVEAVGAIASAANAGLERVGLRTARLPEGARACRIGRAGPVVCAWSATGGRARTNLRGRHELTAAR